MVLTEFVILLVTTFPRTSTREENSVMRLRYRRGETDVILLVEWLDRTKMDRLGPLGHDSVSKKWNVTV